jgi:murein peptide amidase A
MGNNVQRLGRNIDRYLGETIDIAAVLGDCLAAARAHGWSIEEIPAGSKPNLIAVTRKASAAARKTKRVYISAGIHGDEPAGPLAARELLRENRWPAHLELALLPCLNPTGFVRNSRENEDGIDLNREYLQAKAPETRAHLSWLDRQAQFDLCLCLHEDWESHGFYVYELNPDRQSSLAEPMVAAAAEVCPIDLSELIEGRDAMKGIIRPSLDPRARPLWPESFYLITHKTRLSYTLEGPSDFPVTARVAALVAAVRAAVGAEFKVES